MAATVFDEKLRVSEPLRHLIAISEIRENIKFIFGQGMVEKMGTVKNIDLGQFPLRSREIYFLHRATLRLYEYNFRSVFVHSFAKSDGFD